MPDAKTKPGPQDVAGFLAAVSPPQRKVEAHRLLTLFSETSGFAAMIWGGAMVGFGRYAYTYASGHSGESFATGFAPRKAECVLYGLSGAPASPALLADLGPHRTGKSCLYIPHLDRIDESVLRALIRASLDDLATRWPVLPV
jgi:Domain of unknown function (DU1801)